MKRVKRKIRQVSFLTLLVFSFHLFHPLFSAYLHAQTLGTISGKVTDAATGEPLGDILVMAVLKEGTEVELHTARTYIKDGTYTISDLPEGAYQVFIDPTANYVRAQQFTDILVPQGVEIQNVDFALTKGSNVTGKIALHDATTKKDVAVMLVAEDDTSVVTTGETGNFRAQGLQPDTDYLLFASVDEQAFVFTTLTSQTAGQTLQNINLTLGNPASTLSGVVRTGTTLLADAEVRVVSEDTMGYAKTDAQGRYTIKGLKGEAYSVLVTKEGFEDVTQEDIAILEGQQNSADFTMSPKLSGWDTEGKNFPTRNMALKKLFGDKVVWAQSGSTDGTEGDIRVMFFPSVVVGSIDALLKILVGLGIGLIALVWWKQLKDACGKLIGTLAGVRRPRLKIKRCVFYLTGTGIANALIQIGLDNLPGNPIAQYIDCYYACECYLLGRFKVGGCTDIRRRWKPGYVTGIVKRIWWLGTSSGSDVGSMTPAEMINACTPPTTYEAPGCAPEIKDERF